MFEYVLHVGIADIFIFSHKGTDVNVIEIADIDFCRMMRAR